MDFNKLTIKSQEAVAAAQALGGVAADVTIIDRSNHFVFQPLLYQVATAELSPADISAPVRSVLRRHRNIRTLLAEVTGVDTAKRAVLARDLEYYIYKDGYGPTIVTMAEYMRKIMPGIFGEITTETPAPVVDESGKTLCLPQPPDDDATNVIP
ncbi:MAG: hypothetical protein ACI4OV_05140 [Victivallaceae bacterium]